MARVNHKLVRRLMDEKRSKISDRQFFTSRVLALHFEDMAVAQTRRYSYCQTQRKGRSAGCCLSLAASLEYDLQAEDKPR